MKRVFHSRMMLIPIGILLGLAVRAILGPPNPQPNPMQLDSYADLKKQVANARSNGRESSSPLENETKTTTPIREPLVRPLFPRLIEIPVGRESDVFAQYDAKREESDSELVHSSACRSSIYFELST